MKQFLHKCLIVALILAAVGCSNKPIYISRITIESTNGTTVKEFKEDERPKLR